MLLVSPKSKPQRTRSGIAKGRQGWTKSETVDAVTNDHTYSFMKRILSAVFTTIAIAFFSTIAPAQEEARAAWQITNFDITANVQQAERLLNVTAILSATNV